MLNISGGIGEKLALRAGCKGTHVFLLALQFLLFLSMQQKEFLLMWCLLETYCRGPPQEDKSRLMYLMYSSLEGFVP